jgi:hypothetical protein
MVTFIFALVVGTIIICLNFYNKTNSIIPISNGNPFT